MVVGGGGGRVAAGFGELCEVSGLGGGDLRRLGEEALGGDHGGGEGAGVVAALVAGGGGRVVGVGGGGVRLGVVPVTRRVAGYCVW